MGEFDYKFRSNEKAHEVKLMGNFSAPDKTVVREMIEIFNQMGGGRCVLDLNKLTSLDFYGLEMLVLMSDMAQAKHVQLTIRRPRGQVKEMLKLSGLGKIIPIEF